MNTKTQDENPILEGGMITFPKGPASYTIDETKALVKTLNHLIKESCNVATAIEPPVLTKSLFESINDPAVLTIYVRTDQEYHDISMALKSRKDSNTSLIVAIMEYYQEKDSLNIILAHEVMRERGETFYRYTAQFAQQLAVQSGSVFAKVKALYDPQRKELGIFCRQTELNMSVTFLGQLINQLTESKQLIVSYDDMPGTYVQYPSMLHHKIKSKLKNPDIKMIKLKKGLRFIILEKSKINVDATPALV